MIRKRRIQPYRPVYPSPAALITSADRDGTPNIITLGEVFNISIRQPVIMGITIRPATYSHTLISDTKEYVINLPPASLLAEVEDKEGQVERGRLLEEGEVQENR